MRKISLTNTDTEVSREDLWMQSSTYLKRKKKH